MEKKSSTLQIKFLRNQEDYNIPISIRQNTVKYKDPDTGNYVLIDAIGEAVRFDAEAYVVGKKK